MDKVLNLNLTVTLPSDDLDFTPSVAEALRRHADYIEKQHREDIGPVASGTMVAQAGVVVRWERVA
jgi:hypothetical protein